jgi:hypothetical protein
MSLQTKNCGVKICWKLQDFQQAAWVDQFQLCQQPIHNNVAALAVIVLP